MFSELNIGLLIYHLEAPDDPNSLKLLYANQAASEFTGADLSALVGRRILDAFPGLEGSGLPEIYAEVARTRKPYNVGAYEYGGDEQVTQGYYAVKAFPMPSTCAGIVFENITLRKQLEELVKKQRSREKKP